MATATPGFSERVVRESGILVAVREVSNHDGWRVTTSLSRSAQRVAARPGSRIVYYEAFMDICNAMYRERCLRGWRKETRLQLIASANPGLSNLVPEILGNRCAPAPASSGDPVP